MERNSSLVPHSFIIYFAYLTETLTIEGEIDKPYVKKTGRRDYTAINESVKALIFIEEFMKT